MADKTIYEITDPSGNVLWSGTLQDFMPLNVAKPPSPPQVISSESGVAADERRPRAADDFRAIREQMERLRGGR